MENNEFGWRVPTMIFAKALGFLFQENEGVVIDLTEQTKIEGHDEVNKVIVYRMNDQVHIAPCEQDIQEGSFINLGEKEEEQEGNL